MRRRAFVAGVGSAAAWPLVGHAQQPMPVIGFLSAAEPEQYKDRLRVFEEGLKEAGYEIGRNVAIEYRWAYGQNERLPALAFELVRKPVSVLTTLGGTPATLAAKAATQTIPIVFYVGFDPVSSRLVASMNRPGGNLTGVASLNVELMPKRIELMRELLPAATNAALLINPANTTAADNSFGLAQEAAKNLGLTLHVLHASTDAEIDAAFAAASRLAPCPVIVVTDAFFTVRAQQIGALSLRHHVPAAFQYREFTAAGGLVSYGGSFTAPFRPAGVYVGRILKGENPANLPVQQISKLELIVNLNSAKTLGLSVPLSLLGRADEVIE
jgi:putative tryptophan/tyrosine transport system substrate-binding protein